MRKAKKALPAVLLAVAAFFAFYEIHYEVPILMYHRVGMPSDKSEEGLFVSPETFERQMEFLRIHGYHVAPLSEVIEETKNHRFIAPNTVVITFDDGYADNIKNAFPILRKMGFPATIFMITYNIGKPGWLTEEDLRVLDASGVAIGSHTAHHAFLPGLKDDEAVSAELAESKQTLEGILGHPVTLFSYPAGGATQKIEALVKAAGYAGAVTTNQGPGRHDPFALHRIKGKEEKGRLFPFWAKTSGLYQVGKKRITAEWAKCAVPEKEY